MQHGMEPTPRVERLLLVAFAVTFATFAAALATAYFVGFDAARPIAFLAGGMIVALVVASFVFGDRDAEPMWYEFDDEHLHPQVNPATGLIMIAGTNMDAGGNTYGRSREDSFRVSDHHGEIPPR